MALAKRRQADEKAEDERQASAARAQRAHAPAHPAGALTL